MTDEQFIPIGNTVICDYCGEDYTDKPDVGGLILSGNAICPECSKQVMEDVKRYKEEDYISAYCPPETSFADFVRKYRGEGAGIRILSW
jgi:hypothetical protein